MSFCGGYTCPLSAFAKSLENRELIQQMPPLYSINCVNNASRSEEMERPANLEFSSPRSLFLSPSPLDSFTFQTGSRLLIQIITFSDSFLSRPQKTIIFRAMRTFKSPGPITENIFHLD